MLLLDSNHLHRRILLAADVRDHPEHRLLVDGVLPHLPASAEKTAAGVNSMPGVSDNRLGQGLSFPPRVGADGRLAWSAGEENVREAIRVILMTELTERLMSEEFGCGL